MQPVLFLPVQAVGAEALLALASAKAQARRTPADIICARLDPDALSAQGEGVSRWDQYTARVPGNLRT